MHRDVTERRSNSVRENCRRVRWWRGNTWSTEISIKHEKSLNRFQVSFSNKTHFFRYFFFFTRITKFVISLRMWSCRWEFVSTRELQNFLVGLVLDFGKRVLDFILNQTDLARDLQSSIYKSKGMRSTELWIIQFECVYGDTWLVNSFPSILLAVHLHGLQQPLTSFRLSRFPRFEREFVGGLVNNRLGEFPGVYVCRESLPEVLSDDSHSVSWRELHTGVAVVLWFLGWLPSFG